MSRKDTDKIRERSLNENAQRTLKEETGQAQRSYTDPVVFRVRKVTKCSGCKEDLEPGRTIKLVGEGAERTALCKSCAGLGELFFVSAGDSKLTRRLSKYSTQKHVVVRWSSARKRYERQGVLVELAALNQAEKELGLPLTVDDEFKSES